MIFIGQIAIDQRLFPGALAQMAYVFIGDDVGGTWDPDAGENAVILQPGLKVPPVSCLDLRNGPTVFKLDQTGAFSDIPGEFGTRLVLQTEPRYVGNPWERLPRADASKYVNALVGNKIGGSPIPVENEKFPFEDWRLLLQLEQVIVPFWVNFGMGCCLVFSNADVSEAKLLWQR